MEGWVIPDVNLTICVIKSGQHFTSFRVLFANKQLLAVTKSTANEH